MIDFIATFIVFAAVIDPVGTVPVFIAVTRQNDAREKRRIAAVATLASAAILLFFIVAGEVILRAMSIPLPAFRVAGGVVLFLFALTMIFGESKPAEEVKLAASRTDEIAIFPIAVPSIAGPGAILASVLLTENARYSLPEQVQTAITMLAVLAVTWLFMLSAGWVDRLIGDSGAGVISRVMGLVLASAAMNNTLAGIAEYFAL